MPPAKCPRCLEWFPTHNHMTLRHWGKADISYRNQGGPIPEGNPRVTCATCGLTACSPQEKRLHLCLLEPGGHVKLRGLSSAVDLNGTRGTALEFSSSTGRWRVKLRAAGTAGDEAGEEEGREVTVKPENLVPLSAECECVICLEALSKTPADEEQQQYGIQLDYLQLPCDHEFHHRCAVKLFLHNDAPPTCPTCRRQFDGREVVRLLTSNGRGGVNAGCGMTFSDYMDDFYGHRDQILNDAGPSRQHLADQMVDVSGMSEGSAERVRHLVEEMGVDVDSSYENSGLTALMMAAIRNDVECVRALLEHGASIEKVDCHGSR